MKGQKKQIKNTVLVLKYSGDKVNTEYIVEVDRYKPGKDEEIKKTIENKIKNLALLMEKIPIEDVRFLQTLRQQLEAELGRFGLVLLDVKLNFLEEIKKQEPVVDKKDDE